MIYFYIWIAVVVICFVRDVIYYYGRGWAWYRGAIGNIKTKDNLKAYVSRVTLWPITLVVKVVIWILERYSELVTWYKSLK